MANLENITIINANISHAKIIAELGKTAFTENFGHLYNPKDLEDFLATTYSQEIQTHEIVADNNIVFIAYHNNNAVGFLNLSPVTLPITSDYNNILEIKRFYIISSFKGQGVGHQLIQTAIEYAKNAQAKELYLGVYSENHNARRFYAKYNFTDIACYYFKVGNQLDREIIMRLTF